VTAACPGIAKVRIATAARVAFKNGVRMVAKFIKIGRYAECCGVDERRAS
jgi:hypothetical protein